MNLNHKTDYQTGDQLTATAWNNLAADVNELGATGGNSGVVSTEVDPEDANKTFVKVGEVTVAELTSKGEKGTNVGLSGDNNINIEPRPAAGDGSGKNTPGLANRKGGNIALKPGDDIEFWGHKRGTSKSDEVSVKILTEVPKASDPTKTDEVAAKLQLNAADIVLTSKDKQTKSDEMNVTVNKAADTRGYLKVRAQAIDLRCEDHGGIALQPKGTDGEGHENKIKFEHGGGDGLEFGTFNTEKTSIYTNEYRFKKDGVWKMATRETEVSDKADANDSTTSHKYVKQNDDFYDAISGTDKTATTEQIINAASLLSEVSNDPGFIITNDGSTIKAASYPIYAVQRVYVNQETGTYSWLEGSDLTTLHQETTISAMSLSNTGIIAHLPGNSEVEFVAEPNIEYYLGQNRSGGILFTGPSEIKEALLQDGYVMFSYGNQIYRMSFYTGGKSIDLRSGDFMGIEASGITIDAKSNALSLESGDRIIMAGGDVEISGDTVSVSIGSGNNAKNIDMNDVYTLVEYMKTNNQGPWAAA